MVKDGPEFINKEPGIVREYLSAVSRHKLEVNPSRLKINTDGRDLILGVFNGTIKEYPLRRTFLHKLLNWYNFPIKQLRRLSPDTVTSICNDYLMNIRRDKVTIKIELGDALTIVSPDYNEISDSAVIKTCDAYGIDSISRNDFFMSVTTEHKMKTQPIPGDESGIGIDIVNSETGFRVLGVSHFILRYVCTNGAFLKISDDASRVHYGKEDLGEFIRQKIKKAAEQRSEIAEKLKKLTERTVEPSPVLIKRMDIALGKKASRGIIENSEGKINQYDLFNTLTSAAKRLPLSHRHYLETLAGELLDY